MKIRIVIVYACLLNWFNGSAQDHDELTSVKLLKQHIHSNYPSDKLVLNCDTYCPNVGLNERALLHDTLAKYLPTVLLDSMEHEWVSCIDTFRWPKTISMVTVLTSDSMKALFGYNTQKIVYRKRRGLHPGKEVVIKSPNHSFTYMQTTRPILIGNYCLIGISTITGNTTGAYCVYLYRYDNDGTAYLVSLILCKQI
jgi:hypothetical protein